MTRFDIPWEDNYIGVWAGEPARELHIRKRKEKHYLATLLLNGQPIKRPWMNNVLTVDMPATYSFTALDGSDFSIDLWPPNERFSIHLNYEPDYDFYEPPREALTMAISRDADLAFLDQYYGTLGGLEHFVAPTATKPERTIRCIPAAKSGVLTMENHSSPPGDR